MKRVFVLFWFSIVVIPAISQTKLAQTPPMGWNSWNSFACNVSEDMIKEMADAMVSSGLKDAGYEYIVIDDCWQIERDAAGNIVADPERFPSGMKALADYIHKKGLKFGLYTCAGTETCAGRPGSRGHEFADMLQYAKWGVDYTKVDWCSATTQNAKASYQSFADAIKASGRPIVLSICEWGNNDPWKWGEGIGQLWRTTGDITDCWDCEHRFGEEWGSYGIMRILDMQDNLRQYAGPGHWNDPDMMEVGNEGLSVIESRAHFSMWCMLAAPLIAGNDIRKMSDDIKEILTNKEAIAVNQDSRGIQAYKAVDFGDLEYWVKPLEGDDIAICFLNRGDAPLKKQFDWGKFTLKDAWLNQSWDIPGNFNVYDIWKAKSMGTAQQKIDLDLAPHDVMMLKLTRKK